MSSYKLIYFPVRGRGQAIRYICADQGIKLEETSVTNDWPTVKPSTPFGQLPVLHADGLDIGQSNAILRHIARKHGLYGKDECEHTKIDMLNDQQEDLRIKYILMIYKDYENGKDSFAKDLPGALAIFEKHLGLNHGGAGFFVGANISFVDFTIFDLFDNLLILVPTCLDCFPLLKAFHHRIETRDKINKYRQTDAFKKLPVNGNGKQ